MAARPLLVQLKGLMPSVEGLQGQIEPKVKNAIPKIAIKVPKVTPDMFAPSSVGRPADRKDSSDNMIGSGEADLLLEEGVASSIQGADKQLSQLNAVIAAMLAQILSFAVSVGLAFTSLTFLETGSLVGPLVTSLTATLVNVASLGKILKARTHTIYQGMQVQMDSTQSLVLSVLDTADEQVMGPVNEITATIERFACSTLGPIDDVKQKVAETVEKILGVEIPLPDPSSLKEPLTHARAQLDGLVHNAVVATEKLQGDYKDDLKKITAAEATVRKLNPDFDVPDPADLKNDILGQVQAPMGMLITEAEAKIDASLGALKPLFEKANLARDHAKTAQSASTFDVPTAETLLEPLKSFGSTMEKFIASATQDVPNKMTEVLASTMMGKLMTRDRHFDMVFVALPLVALFSINAPAAILAALKSASTVPATKYGATLPDGWLPNTPNGYEMDALKPYYMPVVSQAILVALQLLLTLLLTEKDMACRLINLSLTSFERRLNSDINERIDVAVGKIFEETFESVCHNTTTLTVALTGVMSKIQALLEMVVDMERMQEEAQEMKEQVMDTGKVVAGEVEKTIREQKEVLDQKSADMEARIKQSAQTADMISNPTKALRGCRPW